MSWASIRIWIAVLLLVDAAIGLWFSSHWQRLVPSVNIQRIALIEAGVALVILVYHFGFAH